MKAYQDLTYEGNGEKYRSGKKCIERDCNNDAGTSWSPHWCPQCNMKRLDRISSKFADIEQRIK